MALVAGRTDVIRLALELLGAVSHAVQIVQITHHKLDDPLLAHGLPEALDRGLALLVASAQDVYRGVLEEKSLDGLFSDSAISSSDNRDLKGRAKEGVTSQPGETEEADDTASTVEDSRSQSGQGCPRS